MKHFISAVIKCQKQMASGKAAFGHLKYLITCVGGIVVSIAAFQAVDPGSIPGQRNQPSLVQLCNIQVEPPVVTRMSFAIPHSNGKVGSCCTDIRDGALYLSAQNM